MSAKIWTGDPARPDAQALAVRGGRIASVGTNAEIEVRRGPDTRVIDAKGRRVVPGFIDSHTHAAMGGFDLLAMDLRRTKDPAEFTRIVGDYAKTRPAGVWMTDGAWDHEQWTPARLPTKEMLDPATGDHPTCLSRQDGHMCVCNSLALKLAKITRDTPDPPGGVIVRDANGDPTGVLKDAAMDAISAVRPARKPAELLESFHAAMKHAASVGVTSMQDLPGEPGDLDAWDSLRRSGELTVRITYRPSLSSWEKALERRAAMTNDEWLRIGGVKGYMDGSLGSTTALFFEPYSDDKSTSGVDASEAIPLSGMEDRIRGADRAGLQVVIHAIGDRANSEILDVFERVAKANGPKDRRFRIEHAQHLRASDIPRMAKLGVIASMQPYHAIDDGRWAEKRIGRERCARRTRFAPFSTRRPQLAFGSDWDVAPLSPILGIAAAVTRADDRRQEAQRLGPRAEDPPVGGSPSAYTRLRRLRRVRGEGEGLPRTRVSSRTSSSSRAMTPSRPSRVEKIEVETTVVGGKIVYSR